MLIATIRKLETVTVEVAGEGLPEIQELLEQHRPEGFDLTSAPVAMLKGQTAITATGTYSKRDGLQEIEGADLADVRSKVPDGWQILNVRSA
ncbi:hypothetical protein [Leucobacter japonicus]|uniref:hypothetical protein n=1 Tax=Leucobacter japonicus TaxID=1461259 RepID=UPI0006A79B59|nr:hypothetical protein [Leucobacter japonicus]